MLRDCTGEKRKYFSGSKTPFQSNTTSCDLDICEKITDNDGILLYLSTCYAMYMYIHWLKT